MNLSHFALGNRHAVAALAIAVVIFGAQAYINLPIQLFPETAPPLVNVLTPYPGGAAPDVADLVSDPIETECASLEGVYRVRSTSQDGLSLVTIEFDYGTSVDLAAVDVQNAISRIRSRLPRQIADPQVLKFSTSDRPVLTVGVAGEDLVAMRRLAEDVWGPEIQRVSGVALVDVFGGHVPEISVQVNRDRLETYGLPLGAVVEAIYGFNVSVPAGQIRTGGRQITFRVDERPRTFQTLEQVPVPLPSGGRVLLGNIARIESGAGEDLARFRVDGMPAIALQVFRQDDANTVTVVDRVRDRLRDLEARFPEVRVLEAEESASFTRQVVDNMLSSVWQALLLASTVIILFLGSLRKGLVVAISMPMSFAITFAAMHLLGMDLNLVTLTAIILAVGMVVDASVVVLENITRRQQEGELAGEDAAAEGTTEIQFAVVAGVATTLVVLIPLQFLYGFVGKVFGPLSLTLMLAFSASLIVALGLVPVLAVVFDQKESRLERVAERLTRPWNRAMERLRDGYVYLLLRALGSRGIVIAVTVLLFAASLGLLRSLGMELLPKLDSGSGFVSIETPSGASLDETEQVIQKVERVLLAEPEVVRLSAQVGFEPGMHAFGGSGVQGPTQGFIGITFTPRTDRTETIWDMQDRIRRQIDRVPGIQNFVVRETGGTAKATTAASVEVSIRGGDPLVLNRLGGDLLGKIRSVNGVTNPYRSWRMDQRNTVLALDGERAVELGLTPARSARELALALDGVGAGVYRDRLGIDTPIWVRYAPAFRREVKDALGVRTLSRSEGQLIPFRSIAKPQEVIVQGLVTRENLEPTLQVLSLHQGRPLSFVTADVQALVSEIPIPEGYTVALEGENKDLGESRREMIGALAAAFVGIYLLLVAQFRSFIHPVTVLMSVPLSLIGVSVALWIAEKPVSMPVMVGLILLVGIVVNNAIILLDFIRQRREAGIDRREAIVDSVSTRFRPIMMTSLSTIVGMIPLALEWALGAERFSPLATAVIGGMMASTFLTMIVIPVLYDIFDDLGAWFGKGYETE